MFYQFRKTPNYTPNQGVAKIGFVLHGTLGAYQGAVEWLCTPANLRPDKTQSSAHYVIGRNEGEVMQLVKNEDVSWHAGNVSNPNARAQAVLPKNADGSYKNPNSYFIGIEFAWGYDTDKDGDVDAVDRTLTEWQYKTAMSIMLDSGILYNPNYVLSHKEICDYKTDDMFFACNEIERRMTPVNSSGSTQGKKEDIKKQIIDLVGKL